MSWVAVAVGGAALLGSAYISSQGAKSAAQTAAGASEAAANAQLMGALQGYEYQMPWIQAVPMVMPGLLYHLPTPLSVE